MKVLRLSAFVLTFLVVVVGWVFVIGILRYGSVEGFGTRMKRAVAWSRPPVSYTVPAPDASFLTQDSMESAIARANPTPVAGTSVVGTSVVGTSVVGTSVVGTSVVSASVVSAPETSDQITRSPDHQNTDTPIAWSLLLVLLPVPIILGLYLWRRK